MLCKHTSSKPEWGSSVNWFLVDSYGCEIPISDWLFRAVARKKNMTDRGNVYGKIMTEAMSFIVKFSWVPRLIKGVYIYNDYKQQKQTKGLRQVVPRFACY